MKLKLTVDGKVYEVDVEATSPEPAQPSYLRPASPTRIPAAAPSSPSPSTASSPAANESVADENKVCRSPISGVVVRRYRSLGDFATWRAARAVGDHDLNTFVLRADPVAVPAGVAAGMTALLTGR